MKKIFILFFSILLMLCITTSRTHALSAQSAIVIDATSGRVLFSHNAEQRAGMASTTKIMTAICALESKPLSSVVTVSSHASSIEGSSMYLAQGEKLTMEEVLYGLMLVSGNDAATALAEHVATSEEKFATLMNKKALEIGAVNTNFTNPHGLSDDMHYTTAHDLAKITAYGMKIPEFTNIVSTKTKKVPWKDHDYDRTLVNHNKFLSMYEGCIGVKTGFTKATGRCLVTAVEKNNMKLICVTLNAPDDWNDHRELYDLTFNTFSSHRIRQKNNIAASADIKNGVSKKIDLVCADDIFIPTKEGEDRNIEIIPEPFEDIQAPIKQGDILGSLKIKINGEECGNFPLCAAENVEIKKVVFNDIKNDWHATLKKIFYMWITSLT